LKTTGKSVTSMDKVISPWSVPVAVDDIPDSGMHVEIDAPAEIRAEVLAVVEGLSTVREILSLSAFSTCSGAARGST